MVVVFLLEAQTEKPGQLTFGICKAVTFVALYLDDVFIKHFGLPGWGALCGYKLTRYFVS